MIFSNLFPKQINSIFENLLNRILNQVSKIKTRGN